MDLFLSFYFFFFFGKMVMPNERGCQSELNGSLVVPLEEKTLTNP